MDMTLIVTCVLSSSLAVAIVNGIKELWLWYLNRKAKVDDDAKKDKKDNIQGQLDDHQDCLQQILASIKTIEDKLNISFTSDRVILKDRIKYIAQHYIKQGYITFEDRKALHEMWHIYHFDLEGNGDLDDVMEMIDELELRL